MAPLMFADPKPLASTSNNPVVTNTKLNATANPSQMLYEPHATPNIQPISYNIGPSATLFSSSSVPNVKTIKRPPKKTQTNTVPFVAMNKSVKTFDGLDHQNTPREFSHQTDAHTFLIIGEQTLDPVATAE